MISCTIRIRMFKNGYPQHKQGNEITVTVQIPYINISKLQNDSTVELTLSNNISKCTLQLCSFEDMSGLICLPRSNSI